MSRATIKDVARDAGVSTATVSYIINNKITETISAETTDRVMRSVRRLGYIPNQAARTLGSPRTGGVYRSGLLGVLIPQTESGKEFMFSNPFYGDFISSVEYTARINGYHTLISGINVDQSYTEIAKSRSLEGIIILGMFPTTDLKEYKNSGIPTVLVDCYNTDHFFHTVNINDRYGGYLATQYLIDHGHKKIAFVTGGIDEVGVNQMRMQGYKDALAEADVTFGEAYIYHGDVSFQYGIEAAKKIAQRNRDVTAVFASADIIALGLLSGFRSEGIDIPDDMSVIGFDDIYMSQISYPALTTVRQDITEKGKAAVDIVIAATRDPKAAKRDVTIPIGIVERDSVKQN